MAKGAFLLVLILLVDAISVLGCPSTTDGCKHVPKETFSPPREWVKQRPAPPNHILTLRIYLKQPNFNKLEEHLYAVSDPASLRYGQHLSKEQVQDLVAPSSHGLFAVNDWLASMGYNVHELVRSPSSDWIKVKTTIKQAEKMLNTTYHVWENTNTGDSLVRTTSWSLPDFLHEHIDLVHPTTMFRGGLGRMASTIRKTDKLPGKAAVVALPAASPSAVHPSCNHTITPTCLLELYNASTYTVQAATMGNKIAISSYLDQFANIADLKLFYKALRPEASGSNFTVVSVNGGQNNQTVSEAGGEANLDTQYAFGLTYPTPATVFTTGGSPPFIPDELTPKNTNEPYLDWLDFVLYQSDIPQTISTSYGDDEQTVPPSFAKTVCNSFAQLGARGVTLTFSSGDGGVGDNNPDHATTVCIANDGTNRTTFLPQFPASCPYVTSVGGTVNVPEVAVTSFGSGGGFSNYFPRPAYQDIAVKPFLEGLGNSNKGFFNPSGRGIPDVASQGDNFEVFLETKAVLIGGTSAASPTFAGIIALLNDARIAAGKPSLGFLNPLIYSKATHAFNDITIGSNPGCGTQGFKCTAGWDAVTGLGTPNFGLLKDIVLKN